MLQIYKQLLRILPTFIAVRLLRRIATRSQRSALYPDQEAAMSRAVRFEYGGPKPKVAWAWGEGALVVMIHGWNGRAAQFAPLAVHLADCGFRCVALDVSGHGESPGDTAEWAYFIDDLADLVDHLAQPVDALIGHSAGGLAMMAARKLKGISARRCVCICAPSHPFPPIRAVKQRLDPPTRILEGYKRYIATQFGASWAQLESGEAFRNAEQELLLFYDESDKFVDHSEGDRILQWCKHARLRKSRNYGHSKVLSAQELHHEIEGFLRDDVHERAAELSPLSLCVSNVDAAHGADRLQRARV